MTRRLIITPILVLTVLLVGCSSSESQDATAIGCDLGDVVDGPLSIATTVAPITSIVANIAGSTTTIITGIATLATNTSRLTKRIREITLMDRELAEQFLARIDVPRKTLGNSVMIVREPDDIDLAKQAATLTVHGRLIALVAQATLA